MRFKIWWSKHFYFRTRGWEYFYLITSPFVFSFRIGFLSFRIFKDLKKNRWSFSKKVLEQNRKEIL